MGKGDYRGIGIGSAEGKGKGEERGIQYFVQVL